MEIDNKHVITDLIGISIRKFGITDVSPQVTRPEDAGHGDYTTNICLVLARQMHEKPVELAEKLREAIIQNQNISKHRVIREIKIEPPGFMNFFLSEASIVSQVQRVLVNTAVKKIDLTGQSVGAEAGPTSASGEGKAGYFTEKHGAGPDKSNKKSYSRSYLVEFAHPNTHKAFHIGHLRNITTGESIVRLLESQGNRVVRANYQGDVGMHIAKCLYGIKYQLTDANQRSKSQEQKAKSANRENVEKPTAFDLRVFLESFKNKTIAEKVAYLGKAYAAGSKAFEDDPEAKKIIADFNYLIYAGAQRFDRERGIPPSTTDYMSFVKGRAEEVDEVYTLWKETRQWSLDYFNSIYKRVGSRFDRLYFESECLAGVDLAYDAVKTGVLTKNEGAVIFDGKPYGLDTRVFVNSLGLPTYEGKELSLATRELTEHGVLDRLIHVVGPEQSSFFRITFKAEELLGLQKNQQYHLVYGWVKLKHGKMSSRSGNVVLGEWLLDETKKEIKKILDKSKNDYSETEYDAIAESAAVAAVKYSFLKVGTRQEIAFDIKESVNIQGDSGPYLQYTYARCQSVLRKGIQNWDNSIESYTSLYNDAVKANETVSYDSPERQVYRQLMYFPEVTAEAAGNLTPNTLCTYLFQLAQAFNLFYAKKEIKGNTGLLALTATVASTIRDGLYLLGIGTLERM